MRLMGVVTLVMGLFVFWIFGRNVGVDLVLDAVGSKTSGRIVARTVDESLSVDHVHPTRFRFQYGVSGRTFDGESSALLVPAQLAYTRSVDVEYLSFAPQYARVAGTTRNAGGESIAVVDAAMVAFGACSIGLPWWLMRRKRRAFVNGVPARGTITFIGESNASINGQHPKKVMWTFEDERGRPFTGALTRMSSSELMTFQMNAEVIVLYDRADPTANTLYID